VVLVAPDITELVRFDNLMLFAETVVGETEYTLDSAVSVTCWRMASGSESNVVELGHFKILRKHRYQLRGLRDRRFTDREARMNPTVDHQDGVAVSGQDRRHHRPGDPGTEDDDIEFRSIDGDYNRVPFNKKIELTKACHAHGHAGKKYHVDGRNPVESTVVIRRAEKVLPLTVPPELSFFSVVHQELKWSGSTI